MVYGLDMRGKYFREENSPKAMAKNGLDFLNEVPAS